MVVPPSTAGTRPCRRMRETAVPRLQLTGGGMDLTHKSGKMKVTLRKLCSMVSW